jgi:hypothetical protein
MPDVKGPHADRWDIPGCDPRPLAVEPTYDYTNPSDVPQVLECFCQVCGHGVTRIIRYMRRRFEYVEDAPLRNESASTRLVGAKLEPCGHYVRQYLLVAATPIP